MDLLVLCFGQSKIEIIEAWVRVRKLEGLNWQVFIIWVYNPLLIPDNVAKAILDRRAGGHVRCEK